MVEHIVLAVPHRPYSYMSVTIKLISVPTEEQVRNLKDCLKTLLASGGFEILQWIGNFPSVV